MGPHRLRWRPICCVSLTLALTLVMVMVALAGCAFFSNRPPTAVIRAEPRQGEVPLEVAFDASGSSDPDGHLTAFHWDFGDGAQGRGIVVRHTYTRDGLFTAMLTVTDDRGATATAGVAILVGNPPPRAVASARPSRGWAPLDVRFDGSASEDPGGQIVRYVWDFGDGQTQEGPQPQPLHRYDRPGRYTVTLTVFDDGGAQDQTDLEVRVIDLGMRRTFPTARGPAALAVADFNRDGWLDLAVTASEADSVSVLLSLAGGTGVRFAAPRNFAVGRRPQGIVSADFNGDGLPDLAVADFESEGISLLLGTGDGGFRLAGEVPTGRWPYALAAADFDGDGQADLAVANAGEDSVVVLLGDGVGGFTPAPAAETGAWPSALAVADFNRDGLMDVAVANFFADTVSIYLGDGAGGLRARRDLPVGREPTALATGDLNRDGLPDLVVAESGSDTVSVLLNRAAGRFALEEVLPAGRIPRDVALSDLDGDGLLDLLVVNAGSGDLIAWLAQAQEEGGFAQRRGFFLGDQPLALGGADLDRDGHRDWIAADFSGGVAVLRGR